MEYKVLFKNEVDALTKDVNAAIIAGWKPQGGIYYSEYHGGFFQAIVTR